MPSRGTRRYIMRISTAYTAIGENAETTHEETYFFMINFLLNSRMESGFPSNDEYFDEDVNVYISNLLTSLIYAQHHEMLQKYLTLDDITLSERVSATVIPRTKYMYYRTNADYLLTSLGIFNNPKRTRPSSFQYMKLSGKSYIGRGKAYYNLAQSYALETFRKTTAIGEVMGKLSVGFEKYVKILSLMRGEHFNIYKKFSNGEMYHLERSIDEIKNKRKLQSLYDKFLDAYSRYQQKRSTDSKRILKEISAEIREIDPSFRFSIE